MDRKTRCTGGDGAMTGGLTEAVLGKVIAAAEANANRENEYLADDGLLHCRVCGKPLQTVLHIKIADRVDETRTVRCRCKCPTEAEIREREIAEFEAEQCRERRRRACFCVKGRDRQLDGNMEKWTFAADDRKKPELSDAMRRYAQQFQQHRLDSKGLLLYGDVGTGKTYLAACIANEVIDMGYTARMTNFANIGNELQGTWEKQAYIDDLCKHDLLIIDDLGAERKSEYMQEIVWNVIDARYRAGGPMIITTNLTTDELSKPGEIGYSRIYDRILERCLAVKVDGPSRRRQAAIKGWEDMRKQLGMEVH